MKTIGKTLAAIALVLGAAWYVEWDSAPPGEGSSVGEVASAAADSAGVAVEGRSARDDDGAEAAQAAFEGQRRGEMLRVSGVVRRILADDRDGSPHQRFIIATNRGLTLLVAHNLDLAPRLEGLAVGDHVEIYGEYEWNAQGGVLHWTHDDPQGRHPAGYILWKGSRYQ